MNKTAVILTGLLMLGCARVNLQTAEPLKVDINMRVDVYQHVAKDVASIEDQVYGSSEQRLNYLFGAGIAYAQDASGLDAAIARRKERAAAIEEYLSMGYVGENREALLVVREGQVPPESQSGVEAAVAAENGDRNAIYAATAQKNNADLAQVRKVFLDDHFRRASPGQWFEMPDASTGAYAWVQK